MNLTVRVDVDAPPETVFAAATDRERQGEWILGTTVRVRRGDGRSVGSEVEAVTGLGGFGVTDSMRITQWNVPSRCEVRHTGRVVRGTGTLAVPSHGRSGATFEWTEQWELPLKALGRLCWMGEPVWPLVRPVLGWNLQLSLNRFAGFCRDYPG